MRNCLLWSLLFLWSLPLWAQDTAAYTPGQVSVADFSHTAYQVDSGARAVILADIGKVDYDRNSGDLEMHYSRYTRVHVLQPVTSDHSPAEFELFLGSGDEHHFDKLEHFKAVTYNLENGKIVTSTLEPDMLFREKIGDDVQRVYFTMPQVKAGSILEVSYECRYYSTENPLPWYFQYDFPCVLSQYTVTLPFWFKFIVQEHGLAGIKHTTSEHKASYAISGSNVFATGGWSSIDGKATDHVFTGVNMPALDPEPVVANINDYNTYIRFLMMSVDFGKGHSYRIVQFWKELGAKLMQSKYYGAPITESHPWCTSLVKSLVSGIPTDSGQAGAIYRWVQQHIAWNSKQGIWIDKSLKEVFNTRQGSSAEINLLLISMLHEAGLSAWPVLISTRGHGEVFEQYPQSKAFNHTIAWLSLQSGQYYLDASNPLLGFGKLPLSCYNGMGRLLTTDAPAVILSPDSLAETDVTSATLTLDSSGNWSGHLDEIKGDQHSLDLRTLCKEKGMDSLRERLTHNLWTETQVTNFEANVQDLDKPLTVKFDFTSKGDNEDRIYLVPVIRRVLEANPLKAATRLYPLEWPYLQQYNFTVNINLPENYTVEEIPPSGAIKLPDGTATYRYVIQQNGHQLQLHTALVNRKANYLPTDYGELQAFFDAILKKEAAQVILRRS